MSQVVSTASRPLDWYNVTFITAVHFLALLGFATFSWSALGVCLLLWWITGGIGITLGYHRLLTHRSFEAPRWLRYFLALCGTLAVQGGVISWVAGHRVHHAHSDHEKDPHDSTRGFWWSHIGWIFFRDPLLSDFNYYQRFARELAGDPFMRFLNRYEVLIQCLLGAILLALGGWSWVVWGVFVRLVLTWHSTWLVNSGAHLSGYQTYESKDNSRNCWWVALLAFGEGWHNNHHAFPRSARHGLRWWEFDLTYLVLRVLAALGLAWNLRLNDHEKRPARQAA